MIECPICHVMNEDQAHFCSECGQRFAPSGGQPSFQNQGQAAAEPVFPNFPPADQQHSFQQPQAVQDYQQSSNFAAPNNQFEQPSQSSSQGFGGPAPGFGNPNSPPGFGNAGANDQGFANNNASSMLNNPMGSPSVSPPSNSAPFDPPAHQEPPSVPSFDAPRPNQSMEPPSFNAPKPADSATNQSPLPARPKLHSPLFDGPDEHEKPQPSKPIFGGGGKPKGLRSPLLGEDDTEAEPPKPRGGGLRSPLLRGEDDPDSAPRGKGGLRSPLMRGHDDDPPAPVNKPGKGGLRSPLLGAADDDDDYVPQPKPVKPPKGLPARTNQGSGSHLRSPLLGGVDDYEGDEDDDLPPVPGKTPFPHRRSVAGGADKAPMEPVDQTGSGRFPGKGLRSPLLGDADDDVPAPAPRGGLNKPVVNPSGRQRLHSPIMDGPGSQNFEAEYDEPYYEEIDDPNVLRSPLLAARSKHLEPPAAPQVKAKTNNPAPPVQPPATFPSTNSFAEPAETAAAQPEFRDRGFPAPQPPGDMWRDRGFPENPRLPDAPAQVIKPGPTPVMPASPPEVASPSIKESSPPPLRRSSRSGLLGAGSDDFDEQPINNFRSAPAAPAKPAMILIIPCFAAVGAKLWYMSLMGKALTDSLPFLADQLMQLVVIIALIIFAMTAGKR